MVAINRTFSANSSNTIAAISKEQQYTVAISVASGCITVDTVLLKVFVANDLLVPNIFSPNNDGQNDKLFVNLVGVKTLQYFRVFNRYGKKIFETANLAEGWDGKLNGVPQPVDTYMWTASGLTKEGALVYREGTITLVR
jgi:gliding motility-associated-like protein